MRSRFLDPGSHGTWASLGLLILRVSAGSMLLAFHGWGKLLAFGESAAKFPDPLGIGSTASMACTIGAEVACAALIVLGLATRLAALPAAFAMGVAAFMVLAGDPWAEKELALLYMAPFLALVLTGAGRFSLDARLAGGRRRAAPAPRPSRARTSPP